MATEKKTIYSVMVSSTYTELADHRRAVREAMPSLHLLPVAMEYDAALPDQDLIDASLAKVDGSDAYVGLISYRYGQIPKCKTRNPDKLSLTELEFRRAVARKLPICMFIMHPEHQVPMMEVGKEVGAKQKLRAFVQLAKKDRIYAEFRSVDDLKTKAVQSLVKLREVLDNRSALTASTLSEPRTSPTKESEGGRAALSNIPIAVPRHFLGRDDALEAIDAALRRDEGRVAITALHGLRGVGKTTLAAAYAERHRSDYRATWWIRAQTESTMRADLVSLGVSLGWVAADEKEEPALANVRERLRREGAGILLTYDNAIEAASLRPYLPAAGAARMLVTSNDPAWRKIATPIEIRVWSKEVGADYLIARTGRDKEERPDAEALSEVLGGLPLAHEQAAAYCERLGLSLSDYRQRFEAAPTRLLDAAKDAPAEYHDSLTVAKSFALAIDEAAKLHPAAEPLIVHAALLAPEPIPLYLFSEAREKFGEPLASQLADDGLDEAVAALRAFALVDRETIADERDPAITTDTIRLHRLVRTVAAGRLQGEAAETARRALIQVMAGLYPRTVFNDPRAWPRVRRLDALAIDLVAGPIPPPGTAARDTCYLLCVLGEYRQSVLAAYSQARPILERAMAISEEIHGTDGPGVAPELNNLASLLQAQGDLVGARPLIERALAICEKAFGPDHPDTAASLNNLAALLRNQGQLAGARPLFERALAIREKALGPEHPLTATSLNNLALLLREQGDLVGTQPLFERALAIHEKVYGGEHPEVATDLNNLALLLRDQGALAGARPLFERALAIDEKVYGGEHPEVAAYLNNLGRLLQDERDLPGAQRLLNRALAIREKALGPEHPETNLSRGNLASVRLAQGAPSEALAISQAALGALEKALGADHTWTKAVAGVKAAALDALGRADEAAALRARYGLGGGSA